MTSIAGQSDHGRVRRIGWWRRLLQRPELGAVAGTILVFAFFAVVAGDKGFLSLSGTVNYLVVSAQLGIVAVAIALLMIAGEFDLSVGSMIGFASILVALPIVEYGWPLWAALLLAFAAASLVGLINGYIVITTGLPSFIVTLAFLFILRGATIGVTRLLTDRTQISGVTGITEDSLLAPLLGGAIGPIPVSIFWWIGLTVLATWVLLRTGFGNWIFGTGGDTNAARNLGVPVNRVKLLLFMTTAMAATLVAALQVMSIGSADVLRGELVELQVIVAAVIGGTLLTGGYGSAIGASLGALIFGMVNQGLFFTGVDSDWFRLFVGLVLLIAVIANNFIRRQAMEG